MSPQARATTFGSAGVLVAAGIVCAIAFGGMLGPLLAFVLIGIGLVLATSLAFLEVGLSDDRERARELARVERLERRSRPRFTRMRSHRRGLP
jgi:uncharacterized membrane protein YdjX (TVP38/TMEM64 family)